MTLTDVGKVLTHTSLDEFEDPLRPLRPLLDAVTSALD
jgi:hypothetical protein